MTYRQVGNVIVNLSWIVALVALASAGIALVWDASTVARVGFSVTIAAVPPFLVGLAVQQYGVDTKS